jgi:hypothetical protein
MAMKKQQIQSATSLPPSPDAERRTRMIKYMVTMSIRLVCFIAAIFVQLWWHSWWTLVPLAGAIILPYVAVVLANTVIQPRLTPVERPGSLLSVGHGHSGPDE